MSLLEVRDLRVEAVSEGERLALVDGVSFDIAARERVALVGESGSGKSVTARALMKLDESLTVTGSIRFDGLDITGMCEADLAAVRGRRMSMVFQDPLSALNPTMPIGEQVAEPLLVHGVGRREARRRAVAALDDLGIPDAARRSRAYPHEFSGGMRQRVVLAMALVGEPDLLVADEPTTALDVRVQAQVLDLLDRVAAERDLAVLMITHDVGVVAGFADRVLVMYSGRVAESSGVHALFDAPAHPYTRGLLQTVPHLDTPPGRLVPLPGMPPSPGARPSGCAFHPRCPVAVDACRTALPVLRPAGASHEAACHLVGVAS